MPESLILTWQIDRLPDRCYNARRPVTCPLREGVPLFGPHPNPVIPYVLLGSAPQFLCPDLPCTSMCHAEETQAACRQAGLQTVCVGNRHLLSQVA